MKKIILTLFFVFTFQHTYTQWVSQNIPGSLYSISGIDFYNAQVGGVGGWVFSGEFSVIGKALYTTNGGTNWVYSLIPDSLRVIVALQYMNPQEVYGFGVKNTYTYPVNKSFVNRSHVSRYFDFNNRLTARGSSHLPSGGNDSTRAYFMKSTNGGQSWVYQTPMAQGIKYFSDGVFINNSTGFGAANTYYTLFDASTGIVRTTNGGLNWVMVSSPDSAHELKRIKFADANTGAAVGFDRVDTSNFVVQGLIMRTTNGGSTWSKKRIIEINNFTGVSFANATTGIACGISNDVVPGAHYYKTTNAGASWFKLPFQVDTAFTDGINFVSGTGRGFAFGSKFKEDPKYPGIGIISGYFINRTTDYGLSWHKSFYPDTESLLINSADIDQNTWYISGGNFYTEKGIVLKTTNGGGPIGINPISSEIPIKFNVYQNYPNPFNPSTKIKFDMPKSGNVSFKVFDILGRLVYELGEYRTAGIYEIDFDASGYSSGIYYYRVEAGNSNETKKMVLLK